MLTKAQKTAATKLGITYAGYEAEILAGRKWCGGCASFKDLRAFGRNRSSRGNRRKRDGKQAHCRKCIREYRKVAKVFNQARPIQGGTQGE